MTGRFPLPKKNALLVGLALLGAIPYGWAAAAGVALGGAIQMLSLQALTRTVGALAEGRGAVSGRALRFALAFRFLLVVGLVGWILTSLPVDPLGLAVGLGAVIPAALWHGLERG